MKKEELRLRIEQHIEVIEKDIAKLLGATVNAQMYIAKSEALKALVLLEKSTSVSEVVKK